ncbi:hypothetical protein IFM89_032805 [Coptis chinensis]|uniref:RRM domain-containing protein n=1 Tax=Coptis chinensis TaxID=261450 RepID=A0A835HTG8_9MAGN|nr:hypothetical protein IFM89_032805 [Coptis chinensis]
MVDQLNNNKLRWGDLEDEDDRNEEYIYFAPPEVITEPDANGVKKIITYKLMKKGGKLRGFGFVNFVHKGDAEKAIAKLNGYGYDNLILRVEWAAPRTN